MKANRDKLEGTHHPFRLLIILMKVPSWGVGEFVNYRQPSQQFAGQKDKSDFGGIRGINHSLIRGINHSLIRQIKAIKLGIIVTNK